MDILKKLLLAFVALVIIGCRTNLNRDFNRVELLMNESPQTALAVLDSIKQFNIKGKAANARFALL